MTNKTIAQRELEKHVKALKENFRDHLNGYLAHVKSELESTLEMIKSDYSDEVNPGMISIPVDSLTMYFDTGKHSLKDAIETFWDHEGDSPFDRYEDLDTELDKLESEIDGHLKDDESEDHTYKHETLTEMAEKYRLSDSQYYQDEIIKILENEYNLVLIVAPANNQ